MRTTCRQRSTTATSAASTSRCTSLLSVTHTLHLILQPHSTHCRTLRIYSTQVRFCFSAVCDFFVCASNICGTAERNAPNSHGRRIWSLARMSLNVKDQGHHGQKNALSTAVTPQQCTNGMRSLQQACSSSSGWHHCIAAGG